MTVQDWYASGHFLHHNDLRVFYRKEGKGPPLLCIHGFPSSSWDFEKLWYQLTQHFTVIAYDLIGLGKSSKPDQTLNVSLQADIAEAILADLAYKKAHILSHDLGDTVAQELLARQMEENSGIQWLSCVMLNGGIFPETHQPLLIQKLLISSAGSLLAPLMSKKTFKANMINIFSKEHPPEDDFIKETWNLIIYDKGKRMIPKLIRYMKERVKQRARWVTPLENNLVPLRLINGIQDPISGAHAAQRFLEVVPNADIVRISDAGHYPHLETPIQVLDAIMSFHQKLIKDEY
jgi:pimeloyl-ACP methyl ester carboxylesterase